MQRKPKFLGFGRYFFLNLCSKVRFGAIWEFKWAIFRLVDLATLVHECYKLARRVKSAVYSAGEIRLELGSTSEFLHINLQRFPRHETEGTMAVRIESS